MRSRSRLALLALPLGLALGAAAVPSCSDDPIVRPTPDAGEEPCVPTNGTCLVEFVYPFNHEQSVELRGDFAPDGWEVGIPLELDGTRWKTGIQAENGRTIRYKYLINGTEWVSDHENPSSEPDGFGADNSLVTPSCEQVECDEELPDGGTDADPPPGTFDWRSAVMYFVFVDRFHNGDLSNDYQLPDVEGPANYQGGDFAGVLEKLEAGYFDDLGVNCLWLTVPMDNPNTAGKGTGDDRMYSAYHGYWPSDLDAVEEHFGDMALLKKLVDAAHARGIKVLIDYAMNHVHSDAELFKQNPDWFWPLYHGDKYCVCGVGCSWDDDYEQRRCWFTDYLPDWNFQNAEARAYSVNNAIQWIKDTGIDGFRLDAVKHIEIEWISDLRKRVEAEIEPETGQRFYMVGETFETGNRDVLKKYVGPTLLDGQFDFPLRGVAVDVLLRRSGAMSNLDEFLDSNDSYYPGVMSTFIGNHDIARVIHTALDEPWDAWANGGFGHGPWDNLPSLPNYRAPFERMAVGFTFLFTTQGVPLVYYGDEIGLPGAGDPDNRRYMQWDGYTSDQSFLRDRVAKLGQIRKAHPALWKGKRTRASVSFDTYGYVMESGDDVVHVALNRGDNPAQVGGMPAQARDLLTGELVEGPTIELPPRSSRVLVEE